MDPSSKPAPPTPTRVSGVLKGSLGVLLLFLAIGAILWTWRRDRGSLQEVLTSVNGSLASVEKRLQIGDLDRHSLSRVLQETDASVKRLEENLRRLLEKEGSRVDELPKEELTTGDSSVAIEALETLSDKETEDLIELPQGVNARAAMLKDLHELLKDNQLNPSGKILDEIALSELRVEFARSKARVDVLEAEMYCELTKARASLRKQGGFIVYSKGEKYESLPGVLTTAEPAENGGVRIYYLRQSEFPEFYAKRTQRNIEAERGLRAVVKHFRNS